VNARKQGITAPRGRRGAELESTTIMAHFTSTNPLSQSANGFKPANKGTADPSYLHVQRGDLLVGVLATTSSATLGAIFVAGPYWATSLALFLQLFAVLMFCSSVIQIANGHLLVRYGPGWIGRTIPLRDIVSCGIIRSVFSYGWGVRRTSHGYSYRPSQSIAVELQLINGRRVRIGTDRPLELVDAILVESAAERSH
jgi:hypothetical protein